MKNIDTFFVLEGQAQRLFVPICLQDMVRQVQCREGTSLPLRSRQTLQGLSQTIHPCILHMEVPKLWYHHRGQDARS